MNESVVIKEGGLTRRLAPIDKLKVSTTDNKDSMWVPTGKANTGVLHASENGIYIASEDGYEAYSEVIVRVTKDSFEGDTSFDDWDYETPDMDLDNWDPETIEDFELEPDGFDDVFNNEDEWKDIDKPIDIKMENPKIQDTKISGIDPVTGNEMEVGLDEDGYLTESTLPSSIKIEVPPSKLQYVDGQPIYLRGIVVKAYTADGNLWTNESHQEGVISENELDCDPKIASAEEGDRYELYDVTLYSAQSMWISPGYPPDEPGGSIAHVQIKNNAQPVYGYSFGDPNNSNVYAQLISKATFYAQLPSTSSGMSGIAQKISSDSDWYSFTYVHGDTSSERSCPYISWEEHITFENQLKNDSGSIPKRRGNMTVTVMWTRSDGEVLTDTYDIVVLPDPDGAHPKVDPNTVEWNHRRYKANEDLGAVEVRHGSVYMEGGAIYDVGAAVKLGMLEPVDNEIVP